MFCGQCGTYNPDTNQFCKNCGKPLRKTPAATQTAPAPGPVSAVPPQPVAGPSDPLLSGGVIPADPVPAGQPPAALVLEKKPKRNWLAIACLGLSLLSWVTYPYIIGIIAVLTGAGAIYTSRKLAGKVPVLAVIGILIAMGSIVFNFYYLDLFAPDLLPPHT